VTIAAGFRCMDGVVIGADTQIEEGEVKYDGEKLLQFPCSGGGEAVVTGAGDFDAIGNCAMSLHDKWMKDCGPYLADYRRAIQDFTQHRSYRALLNQDETFCMIIALRSEAESGTELIYVEGGKVTPEKRYKVVGTGWPVTRFFAEQLWNTFISVDRFEPFLVSIIKGSKLHHSGVGGGTKVKILPNQARPPVFKYLFTDEFLWGTFDSYMNILRCAQKPDSTEQQFKETVTELLASLGKMFALTRPTVARLDLRSTTNALSVQQPSPESPGGSDES
jgi:hypothetical protein